MTNPNCEGCTLRCGKENIIWGKYEEANDKIWVKGNRPDLLVIGEAPGEFEVYKKEPFVGDSGRVLRKTLSAIREQTHLKDFTAYFTNVVMCRPPNNRTPTEQEIANCYGRLCSEIEELKPKNLLLLGATALQTLFGPKNKISMTRGKILDYKGIRTLATWHPSYILRVQPQFQTFVDDIVRLLDADANDKYDWASPRKYELINTVESCTKLFKYLSSKLDENNALDIETAFSTDPFNGKILVVGIYDSTTTWIITDEVFKLCAKDFDPRIRVIVHQSLFEWPWFKQHYNIELEEIDDTLLMYHLLDERTKGVSKSLKTLGKERLGVHDWDAPVKEWLPTGLMHKCPPDILHEYLSYDVNVTKPLYENIKEEMISDGVWDVYQNVVRPAIPFVNRMTARGVTLDLDYLEELSGKMEITENSHRQQLCNIVGNDKFNPGSWQQVAKVLYEDFGLRGKGTGESVLNELREGPLSPNVDEFIKILLDFRKNNKLRTTYVNGLIERCSPDSRIREDFKLEGTETGRLSSFLHTMPRPEKELGALIRRAFVADEGCYFIDPDYKQLEARVAAHFSGDKKLTEFINSDKDIHYYMASLIWRKPESQITKEQRQLAKNGFFAVLYMTTPQGFVYNFKDDFPELDERMATRIIEFVRKEFPQTYIKSLEFQNFVINNYYVSTLFGRKRRFPFIPKHNCRERRDILKAAANTPYQGTASDICLLAAMDLEKHFGKDTWRTHIIIHDGIPSSTPDLSILPEVKEIMCKMHFDTNVKFDVEIKVGKRWGEGEVWQG